MQSTSFIEMQVSPVDTTATTLYFAKFPPTDFFWTRSLRGWQLVRAPGRTPRQGDRLD